MDGLAPDIFSKIYRQAQRMPKRIVLPEGNEPRVIKAAQLATKKGLARVILLGKSDLIREKAKRHHLNISSIEIIDPQRDGKLNDYIRSYYELRKHKGLSQEQARDLITKDPVYFAALMLREARVDGFVAGAAHTTSDVARACLRCIKGESKHSLVSGSFLLQIKQKQYGEKGLFLFADCGIVPLPTAEQLATIAITSAEVWGKITGFQGRLAMLSFSTKGSGKHAVVDKVRQATAIVKRERPDLIIDGELQLDSAVEPAVAQIKAPGSPLAGRANILIFPNLDTGNIAYKLMQRLAQARVVGPIIQGLSRPCSDLSRGCDVRELVDAIAVTNVRAQ